MILLLAFGLLVRRLPRMDFRDTIDALVAQRQVFRRGRKYEQADEIKNRLEAEFNVELKDFPYKEGGHSSWTFKREIPSTNNESFMALVKSTLSTETNNDKSKSESLGRISSRLDSILDEYKISTELASRPLLGEDVLGRKFADAALLLSFAGVEDEEIFDKLAECCSYELKRFGARASCRAIDILQMMERMAAAGVRQSFLFTLAANILRSKGEEEAAVSMDLFAASAFPLYELRPLNVLYHYSSRQRKCGRQEHSHERDEEEVEEVEDLFDYTTTDADESYKLSFESIFRDPTLPLVIDLGCGFGVNLLSLAASYNSSSPTVNFLGCDLASSSLRYARGISFRLGLNNHLHFLQCDVYACVTSCIQSYPGKVIWVFVNFPTPYSFELLSSLPIAHASKESSTRNNSDSDALSGNRQLPTKLSDFMLTTALIENITRLFAGSGCLQIQSNVEDVALMMHHLITQSKAFNTRDGFRSVHSLNEAQVLWKRFVDGTTEESAASSSTDAWMEASLDGEEESLRQKKWREMSGLKAIGPPWLSRSPLPKSARTETEAAYEIQRRSIYRTVYLIERE